MNIPFRTVLLATLLTLGEHYQRRTDYHRLHPHFED